LFTVPKQKELVIIIEGERGTPQLTAVEAMIDGALMRASIEISGRLSLPLLVLARLSTSLETIRVLQLILYA
jgi:hypothetical protein